MSSGPLDDDDLKQTTVAPSRPQMPSEPGASSGRVAPVRPGEVLAGKYQVGAVLGQGGVGVVVSATHLLLQQKVAIKVLLDSTDPEQLTRFLREGQSAARLKGQHVARVLDMGQLPGGAPFMVMEFLEGRDLSVKLEQEGPLPVEEAAELMVQACEAMAEAHAAGIVHRDLKPANLFLTRAPDGAPCLKVVDFGISRDLADPAASNHRLTRTQSVFGSPLYMSPEQMRSTRLTDARSDIWALGVILYELLTGRTPFDAEFYPDLVLKVATEPPPPPSSLQRLPPELEAVILRCLEKRPESRFQDVGELAVAVAPFAPARAQGALERILRCLGTTAAPVQLATPRATPVPSVSAAAPAPAAPQAPQARSVSVDAPAPPPPSQPAWAQTAAGGERASQGRRQDRVKVVVAAGLGALLMGLGAVAVIKMRGGAGAEPTPAAEAELPHAGEAPQVAAEPRPAQGSGAPQVIPGGSAPPPAEATAAEPPAGAPEPRPTAAQASATPKKPAAGKPSAAPTAAPPPQEAPPRKNSLDLPEM